MLEEKIVKFLVFLLHFLVPFCVEQLQHLELQIFLLQNPVFLLYSRQLLPDCDELLVQAENLLLLKFGLFDLGAGLGQLQFYNNILMRILAVALNFPLFYVHLIQLILILPPNQNILL